MVASQYGTEYLPDSRGIYQTKVKNAQEAHEAIRPAGHPFDLPEALRGRLSPDEFRLYDLIWKRTVASQMADARGRRITISVEVGGAMFEASGKTIDFPGYLRAYVEGSDDPEGELAGRDVVLPPVAVGEALECRGLGAQEPHHAAAQSLQRGLADPGAGRNGHRPAQHLRLDHRHDPRPRLRVQVEARQRAGADLDGLRRLAVAGSRTCRTWSTTSSPPRWKTSWTPSAAASSSHLEYLRHFYFGNDQPGLKDLVENKAGEIDARDVSRVLIGKPEGQPEVYVRVGRYGPFLEQGERRASLPDKMPPDELTLASRPGDAGQGRAKRGAAGRSVPQTASRSSSRSAASALTCSGARPTATKSRKTPRC